jgi:hypothetical protein
MLAMRWTPHDKVRPLVYPNHGSTPNTADAVKHALKARERCFPKANPCGKHPCLYSYPLRRHHSNHDFSKVTLENFPLFQAYLEESSGCGLKALLPDPNMLGSESFTLPLLPSTTCSPTCAPTSKLDVMQDPTLALIEAPSSKEGDPYLN